MKVAMIFQLLSILATFALAQSVPGDDLGACLPQDETVLGCFRPGIVRCIHGSWILIDVCGDRGCEWDKQHTDPTCRLSRLPPCDPKKDEPCEPPGPPSQRSEASSANSFRLARKIGLFGRRRRAP